MGFLSALAADLIQKLLTWIGTLLVKQVKEHEKIVDDEARAVENAKKVVESKTDEERHKNVEDLFNNH